LKDDAKFCQPQNSISYFCVNQYNTLPNVWNFRKLIILVLSFSVNHARNDAISAFTHLPMLRFLWKRCFHRKSMYSDFNSFVFI